MTGRSPTSPLGPAWAPLRHLVGDVQRWKDRLHWVPTPIRPARRVLFLTYGLNPSFDYYFRSRLEIDGDFPHTIFDTKIERPDEIDWPGACVVICRYLPSIWRTALARYLGAIGSLALFLDDDMPALVKDASVPLSYRWRIARDGLDLWPLIATAGGQVLVSTAVLAARMQRFSPVLLPPIPAKQDVPQNIPPTDCPENPFRVIFHATDSHAREHHFAVEMARQVAALSRQIRFDVVASSRMRGLWRGIGNADLRDPLPWIEYRALAQDTPADLLIAPLLETRANLARSPTKAIDALRFNAAGLFADLAPYAALREVAPLLPLDPAAWAREIHRLALDRPALADLRQQLHRHVTDWRNPPAWPATWPLSELVIA